VEPRYENSALFRYVVYSHDCDRLRRNAGKAIDRRREAARSDEAEGCKLVGMVRGTKLWAGECTATPELKAGTPAKEPSPTSFPGDSEGIATAIIRNLCSITTNQAAIIKLLRVINRYVGNLPLLPAALTSSINQPHCGRGDWPYGYQQLV